MTGKLTPPEWMTDRHRAIWNEYLQLALAAGVRDKLTAPLMRRLVSAAYEHDINAEIIASRMYDDQQRPLDALALRDRAAKAVLAIEQSIGLTRRKLTEPMQTSEPMRAPGTWFCPTHKQWHGTCHCKDGSRCHGKVVEGTSTCRMHPGRNAKIKHLLAVEQRRNPIAGEPKHITPVRGLIWRVEVIAGEIERLDVWIAALQAEEVVWGKISETDDEEHGKRTVHAARLNMWVQYRAEREREFRLLCSESIQAGVAAEMVKLAREQGELVARVMLAFATEDLGLAADDPRIVAGLPHRLRELTG